MTVPSAYRSEYRSDNDKCNASQPSDQCYRLENGTWKTTTPLPARLSHGALVQLSGTMVWFGGELSGEMPTPSGGTVYVSSGTVNNVYTLSLAGKWTTATPMMTKRERHCVVVFNETVAIIIGM